VYVSGDLTADPVGRPWRHWPVSFELVDHLNNNATPCLSAAFPRGAYADLGYRFDEEMLATEDWEYLVRVAALVGVESGSDVTSVYRWWLEGESSRTAQTPDDWAVARERVAAAFDDRIMLLPRGSARRVRWLFDEIGRVRSEVRAANEARDVALAQHEELVVAQEQALSRAQTAEEEVVALRRRLRRQRRRAERRLARLRRRLEESAAAPPSPRVLERLVTRGVSLLRSRGSLGRPPADPQ
jgi:hypothetical protein